MVVGLVYQGVWGVFVHGHVPVCAPGGLRCSHDPLWCGETLTWPPDAFVHGPLVVPFLMAWPRGVVASLP